MKRKMFLLAVLFYGTYHLSAQEDPYLLWQTTDPLGYSGFVIHPNGNIIANRNCEFFEIDGNTGQQIRAFPVQTGYSNVVNVSVSKDGKYFASTFVGFQHTDTYIFEYNTGEVFKKLDQYGEELCFFPDSKRLLVRGYKGALTIYNLETETSEYNGPTDHFLRNFAISDDGKFIATGGVTFEDNEGKVFNILRLWDAVTLKPIKELGKFEGDNEVRSIKFSPDGKYVGFHISLLDIKVYDLNNFTLIKYYLGGMFDFISGNFFSYYSSNWPQAPPDIMIKRLNDDKSIYSKRALNGGNEINHNFSNNTLIYLDSGQLWAVDITRVLTTVTEPKQKSDFSVKFEKGLLLISDLKITTNQINITISDISGRVIRKLNSPVSNSELRIPLKLPNGTYLIHIQDGNQEYSSKFLVTE
jgi:WD40 repeat protein